LPLFWFNRSIDNQSRDTRRDYAALPAGYPMLLYGFWGNPDVSGLVIGNV
jgi:hypothetical protein